MFANSTSPGVSALIAKARTQKRENMKKQSMNQSAKAARAHHHLTEELGAHVFTCIRALKRLEQYPAGLVNIHEGVLAVLEGLLKSVAADVDQVVRMQLKSDAPVPDWPKSTLVSLLSALSDDVDQAVRARTQTAQATTRPSAAVHLRAETIRRRQESAHRRLQWLSGLSDRSETVEGQKAPRAVAKLPAPTRARRRKK
jgi:hypothetical protein